MCIDELSHRQRVRRRCSFAEEDLDAAAYTTQDLLVGRVAGRSQRHQRGAECEAERWRDILRSWDVPSYTTILPGHGLPAGRKVLSQMDSYLAAASDKLGDDGARFTQAMIEHFPDRRSPIILDIGNLYLFGTPLG